MSVQQISVFLESRPGHLRRVLDAFEEERPKSGYVTNIQGDLAVSANKRGVLVEPMSAFRARRKK